MATLKEKEERTKKGKEKLLLRAYFILSMRLDICIQF